MLNVKLKHLDAWSAARQHNAEVYNEAFEHADLGKAVETPRATPFRARSCCTRRFDCFAPSTRLLVNDSAKRASSRRPRSSSRATARSTSSFSSPFRTISRAADYAKSGAGRRTTLVLLSDMLQSTADVNMERAGGIPSDAWTDALKRDGRLPDLRNVCVFVIGGDPTTRTGARVRHFWEHWFQAAGATFPRENYRNMVADPGEIGCGPR